MARIIYKEGLENQNRLEYGNSGDASGAHLYGGYVAVPLVLLDTGAGVRRGGSHQVFSRCAKPVPSAGRRLKAEKAGAQSDPVGDDWMFGKMGSKGLFARRR